jgi:ribosome-associated protein
MQGEVVDTEEVTREIRDRMEYRFSRSGGPGGQNVNKLNTKVTARLRVADLETIGEGERARLARRLSGRLTVDGKLVVHASEERSQLRNRERAEARMVALVLAALRPDGPPRRPTKPSRASRERRLDAKNRRGAIKRNRRFRPGEDD